MTQKIRSNGYGDVVETEKEGEKRPCTRQRQTERKQEDSQLTKIFRSRWLISKSGGKTSAKDEYLMGGRQMPPLPVALSLLTTFLSGILMLGVPAEMFQRDKTTLNFFKNQL